MRTFEIHPVNGSPPKRLSAPPERLVDHPDKSQPSEQALNDQNDFWSRAETDDHELQFY
jgi:hypothetical protein